MFYGREDELKALEELWMKSTSSLVTCRGRRRIGKSSLIMEFARRSKACFIAIDGLAPHKKMNNGRQLANFVKKLRMQLPSTINAVPEDWYSAFQILNNAITDDKRTVVLLDEISWMGKYDDDFPGYLKSAWDNMLKHHPLLILVLCGSVSSWITDNIMNSTGFVGRRSMDMVVGELQLSDCRCFWGKNAAKRSEHEMLEYLSVTGGIPRYLEEIRPALNSDENIRRTCFMPNGYLFNDFKEIFNDIFGGNAKLKLEILKAIAEKPMSGNEIAECTRQDNNGAFIQHLNELAVAGFITYDRGINPETGSPARLGRFRLKDNYARFYLRYILPNNDAILNSLFNYVSLSQLPEWNTIVGLQFENLVLNNLHRLLQIISLEKTLILSATPYRKKSGRLSPGCQIDLLIQTKYIAYVVEIKYRQEITSSVIQDVERKIASVKFKKGTRVRTVLVYEGHLAPSIVTDGYFDFLVPAEKLLN